MASKNNNNSEASGFLPVHKPSGITSFDVIRHLRRILGIRKLGHSGVLDRPASGVLVIGANKATRLFELFAGFEKEYEAEIWLGLSTSTDDLTGELLQWRGSSDPREMAGLKTRPTADEFEQALGKYRGSFAQTPPAFSLAKKAGKESYRYALAGESVEVAARQVTVHASRLLEFEQGLDPAVALAKSGAGAAEGKLAVDAGKLPPLARGRVWLSVSGGLYVRALARDIGRDLGCGAAMGRLVRTRVGPFRIDEALTLEELEARIEQGASPRELLQPLSAIAPPERTLRLDATQAELLRRGLSIRSHRAKLPSSDGDSTVLFGIEESTGELVALLSPGPETAQGLLELKPTKVVG